MSVISDKPEVVWHVSTLANLHWRRWVDEWVVFDEGSGQTHQMDTLTAVTLLLLEADPDGTAATAQRVATELQVEGGPQLLVAVSSALEGLFEVGLIEVV